jgi:hypothetical protein
MPIWLRKFTYNKIKEFYDKERDEIEKANGKNTITSKSDPRSFKDIPNQNVNVPNFVSKVKSRKK